MHAQAVLCVPLPNSLISEAIIGGRPSCFPPWERTQILCFLLGSILCRLQEACMGHSSPRLSHRSQIPQALIFSSAYFDQRPSGQHSLVFLSASPFLLLLVCSTCLWDSTHTAPLPLAHFFPATSLLNLGQPGVARVSRGLRAEPHM